MGRGFACRLFLELQKLWKIQGVGQNLFLGSPTTEIKLKKEQLGPST